MTHVVVDGGCWRNRRGFGRFTVEIVRAILRRADRPRLTLLVDFEPGRGELPEGCSYVNVAARRTVTDSAVAGGRRSVGDMLRFTRAVARARADLVYFPAVYSYFPVPPGTRCVVCFHDTIAEDHPHLVFPDRSSRMAWAAKCRAALWQADRIMTVSESSRDDIVRTFGVRRERIDVVFEGVDPKFREPIAPERIAATQSRLGIPSERPYLLYVGGLSPHKNLGTLLDAMRTALRTVDATLVMAGDLDAGGFLSEGRRLVGIASADPALRDRCVFPGFVSEEDLPLVYRGAYAMVLPSLAEGFCLPAAEAMAGGTPVLASRAGALPEVVGAGGVLFAPGDPSEMSDAIARIVADRPLRDRLSACALERSAAFSWDAAADRALASLSRAAR